MTPSFGPRRRAEYQYRQRLPVLEAGRALLQEGRHPFRGVVAPRHMPRGRWLRCAWRASSKGPCAPSRRARRAAARATPLWDESRSTQRSVSASGSSATAVTRPRRRASSAETGSPPRTSAAAALPRSRGRTTAATGGKHARPISGRPKLARGEATTTSQRLIELAGAAEARPVDDGDGGRGQGVQPSDQCVKRREHGVDLAGGVGRHVHPRREHARQGRAQDDDPQVTARVEGREVIVDRGDHARSRGRSPADGAARGRAHPAGGDRRR